MTDFIRIRKVPNSNLSSESAILTEAFRDCPQSIQENTKMAPRLGHDSFLPDPFLIAIHLSFMKQRTNKRE
jgi:hypothetical protein